MDCEKPQVEETLTIHTNSYSRGIRRIYTVGFSPDQTKLCYAGTDKKVILTNLQNYNTQKIFTGHRDEIKGSDFSSNGNFLVTASADNTSRIWNVESENGNSTKLEGHRNIVTSVRFLHNDPMKVISGSWDKTLKFWDIERKKEISTLKGCKGWIFSVDILPDTQTILSGDSGFKLRIWDFRSGKCVKILDHHKHWVFSVQFHPNTYSFASGSWDKTIKIFDYRTFQLLQNYQEQHNDSVLKSVCFHPSGKFLVSGSYSTIKLFDLSQKKVLYTLKEHSDWVNSVQFSPDGKFFASGGDAKKVLIWNFPLWRTTISSDEKDIDEKERVKYLFEKDLLLDEQEEQQEEEEEVKEDDCCERNILMIRIGDFCSLFCYKILFS